MGESVEWALGLGLTPDSGWRFGCLRNDLSTGLEDPLGSHRLGERDLRGACLNGPSLSCPPSRLDAGDPCSGLITDEGMAVTTMTEPRRRVTVGVDTHCDTNVGMRLDERGAQLGVEPFSANPAGYRKTLAWARSFGTSKPPG